MVTNTSDKSELLGQLKIDKTAVVPQGYSGKAVLLVSVLVAALTAGVMYVFLASGNAREPTEDKAVGVSLSSSTSNESVVSVAPAETQVSEGTASAASTILNASGYITARLVATVSAEVAGLITSIDVEEGMAVTQGQVLARLDDATASVNLRLANARVAVQRARLASAEADHAEAERVLKRVSNLQNDNFSSEADLTQAKANFEKSLAALASINADIDVAKQQVALQQEVYDNHTIRAPFKGVVTLKNAQPGEIVSPGSAGGGFTRTGICTIVDMDSLEIEVDVNEAFIRRVYPGQKVVANLDAYPQWDIPASVIAIIPTADRAKATVRVRIRIETTDSRVLPDMGVKVAFLK